MGSQQPPRERRPFEKGKRLNTSIFYPIVAIVGAVVTGVLMFGLLRVLMPLGIRYELAAEGIEVHFRRWALSGTPALRLVLPQGFDQAGQRKSPTAGNDVAEVDKGRFATTER